MKFEMKCTITIDEDVDPKLLEISIAPENVTMPEGKVETYVQGNQVISTISGTMSIGRLMNTIDDIIKTAILSLEVDDATDLE